MTRSAAQSVTTTGIYFYKSRTRTVVSAQLLISHDAYGYLYIVNLHTEACLFSTW